MSDSCYYCDADGFCSIWWADCSVSVLCEGPDLCDMYEPRDIKQGEGK